MRVLALDLSLTSTGVALPDGTVQRLTTPLRGCERLAHLRNSVARLCVDEVGRPKADLVVVEEYAFSRAAAHSHELGELGGVIRLWLHESLIPWCPIGPSTLKKFATGKGNASKEDMLVAAVKRLGYDGSSNDEADALWLRAAALDAYGIPLVEMPKAQRDALGKVDWPFLPDDMVGVA